ncbi:methyltransferase domain-containing protein [Pontibacterium sp.]|uniref:class I SAM-dependent methyltransferase n=1 Tax=Pontibacterium sp. TaxID=2036026 RepID=UPI003510F45C
MVEIMTLDVGCGQKKLPGSIGLDFSAMSDADYVVDLNTDKFPFDDNTFDFVYSSHCLEHLTVEGFINVLEEVYRVLKDEGVFFVTVPYFNSGANLANPFHNNLICFNEHTFRFFSSSFECVALDASYYATPACPQWGLRYSANSEVGVEFETTYINFYYFSRYDSLSEEEKYLARCSKSDVVDQISYGLKAVKPCPTRAETAPIQHGSITEHFLKQVSYMKDQLVFLEQRNALGFIDDIGVDEKSFYMKGEGVVVFDGQMISVYEAVYLLDKRIQKLQRIIDSHIVQGE